MSVARTSRPSRRRGFTLMEAALVTVVIGVGVVSLGELLTVGTASNGYAMDQTTALQLANNVHEIVVGLPFYDPDTPANQSHAWSTPESGNTSFDDVLDLDGKTFSPPIDVRRQAMTNYSNWAQRVTVQTVGDDAVSSTRPSTASEPTARVTVTILHNSKQVYQVSWLVVAPAP